MQSSNSDQDPRRGLEQACHVQAALEQIEQQLSHRCEPKELAHTRANLARIRDFIRFARCS